MGTHEQPFDRLLMAVEELAHRSSEEFVVQYGISHMPKGCKTFDFCSQREFESYCKKARVVVVHGGVGSIMTPLLLNKPTVVVPRFKRYGEHTNNHQLQITKELEREGRITAVYDVAELGDAIKQAGKAKPRRSTGRIKELIREYLEEIE